MKPKPTPENHGNEKKEKNTTKCNVILPMKPRMYEKSYCNRHQKGRKRMLYGENDDAETKR